MDHPPEPGDAACKFRVSDMVVDKTFESASEVGAPSVCFARVGPPRSQWQVRNLAIRDCWAKWGVMGEGVRVAVIDSGVRATHKDLAHCIKGDHDYTHDQCPPLEESDHGTHVCGIIAAADNGDNVTGVAPMCEIHSFKVFGRNKECRNDNILRALRDIKDGKHGRFDVINMSLGSPVPENRIRLELLELSAMGVVSVCASGNSGDHSAKDAPRFGTTDYPAAYNSTLCVGATDSWNKRAKFTSTGPRIHIMAPGENILSAWPDSDSSVALCSGTSMAAPFVSGVVALLLSYCVKHGLRRPGLDEVLFCLASSATNMEVQGFDDFTGFGLVDPSGTIEKYIQLHAKSLKCTP